MKKYTHALLMLAVAAPLSCSKSEPDPPRSAPTPANVQVVCDKFEPLTEVAGSTLELSVDTDLPDNTLVMVSVSRSYLEEGSDAEHSVDYLSEKSTIGEWRSAHSVSIAGDEWKQALKAKQEEMATMELGFEVASISETITVGMVVPVNQTDPRFGKRNEHLTGKAVSTDGLRVVKKQIEIDHPLN